MVQTAVIPIILGLALIIGGYTLLRKLDKMKQNGELVEGIIFSFDGSSSYSGNDSGPVIRFVTKEGVWVTKEYSEGISHSFMKSGQKVRVIYDPDNPENFCCTLHHTEMASLSFIGNRIRCIWIWNLPTSSISVTRCIIKNIFL